MRQRFTSRRLIGKCSSFFFFFFNFYGCTHSICKFLGLGLNPNHSCDLHHSCGSTGSFNPGCWAGDWNCDSTVNWAAAVGFLTHSITAGTPEKRSFEEQWRGIKKAEPQNKNLNWDLVTTRVSANKLRAVKWRWPFSLSHIEQGNLAFICFALNSHGMMAFWIRGIT